jgi:hypothetical protein
MADEIADYDGGKRRHWGMWLLLVLFLIAGALFGVYMLWSHNAANALDRQVAAYRAAGEPIEPQDFAVRGVSDDDNAALDLRDAGRALIETSEAMKAYDKLDPALPLLSKEIDAIKAVLAENKDALESIDAAMTKKGVDWQIPMTSPAIRILLPDLSHQRRLCYLVSHRAMLEHQQGDDVAALRDLERILFIADALEHQPALISHLVAVGCRAMVTEDVQQMAPSLRIGDGGKGAVPPAKVRQFIDRLLDEKADRAGQIRALLCERMMELDSARLLASGKLSLSSISGGTPTPAQAAVGLALRPMAIGDGLLMIRFTTAMKQAFERSNDFPTFNKTRPQYPPEVMNNSWRHVLARILLPSFDRSIETSFRISASRRLGATALAIRWYRLDHAGKPPASLDELLPKYLPAIGLDPFAENRPLQYSSREGDPILYSNGVNCTDDGGSEEATIPRRANMRNRNEWENKDLVWHLNPRPREYPEGNEEYEGAATQPAATEPVK